MKIAVGGGARLKDQDTNKRSGMFFDRHRQIGFIDDAEGFNKGDNCPEVGFVLLGGFRGIISIDDIGMGVNPSKHPSGFADGKRFNKVHKLTFNGVHKYIIAQGVRGRSTLSPIVWEQNEISGFAVGSGCDRANRVGVGVNRAGMSVAGVGYSVGVPGVGVVVGAGSDGGSSAGLDGGGARRTSKRGIAGLVGDACGVGVDGDAWGS